MTPVPREWTLGTHSVRFEPPNLFWVKFRGSITLPDAMRAWGIYQEMRECRPFVFVAEVGDAGSMDSEAGRYLSENIPSEWVLGNVYIGARLIHRALAKGLALASLLSEHKDKRALEKIHHVSTAAQAMEIVARLRAEHQRQQQQQWDGARP